MHSNKLRVWTPLSGERSPDTTAAEILSESTRRSRGSDSVTSLRKAASVKNLVAVASLSVYTFTAKHAEHTTARVREGATAVAIGLPQQGRQVEHEQLRERQPSLSGSRSKGARWNTNSSSGKVRSDGGESISNDA
eukprot:Opistho-1_new@51972